MYSISVLTVLLCAHTKHLFSAFNRAIWRSGNPHKVGCEQFRSYMPCSRTLLSWLQYRIQGPTLKKDQFWENSTYITAWSDTLGQKDAKINDRHTSVHMSTRGEQSQVNGNVLSVVAEESSCGFENCHVSILTLILGSCSLIHRHNSLSINGSWSEEMQGSSTWFPLTCRCPGIMSTSFQGAMGASWISL